MLQLDLNLILNTLTKPIPTDINTGTLYMCDNTPGADISPGNHSGSTIPQGNNPDTADLGVNAGTMTIEDRGKILHTKARILALANELGIRGDHIASW